MSKDIMRILVILVATTLASSASADEESITYCVELYGGTDQCLGDDIPDACDLANQWDIGLDDQNGVWDQTENYENSGVDTTDFTTLSNTDPTGVDFPDVGIFVGIGGFTNCTTAFFRVGDDGGTCDIPVEDLDMDSDLDMLVLWSSNSNQSCMSLQSPSPYSTIPETNEFKLLNGFHGNTWIQTDDHFIFLNPSVMRAYVDSSEFSGWGDNFVNLFTEFPSGSNNDRCATSTAWADNITEFTAVFEAGGFKDRNKAEFGTFTDFHGFAGVEGCNPFDGETL